MSSQRLFGILVLAVVALAAIPRESSGAPLVVGQDYYSVQLLSGTSAAVLQESLALVADQPYARIEKRGAEYTLRLGYWESRDEAVQAAKVLLPKFRGAHTRIAPYQPDAIVAGAGEQPPIAAVPHPLTGARAPGGGTRETTVQAEREAAKLAAERAEAERRAEAAAQERSAAEARALREATIRQQAEAQAEAAARERVAAEREAMAQAVLREKAETEALRLAESRRDAERRPTAEVSPLRAEPEQSQAQLPGMPRPPQLVAGQDYHSVQLLSGTSMAVLQESLARVAGEPYARIDKRGAAYALRVGYWDTRAEAVQAAKALLRKFRGAHARIATYRPDAIVASAGEQPTRATAPVPSAPEVPPPSIASAAEQPSKASAPVPATPEVSPRRTEPAQLQAQVPAVSREEQQNKPELARQIEYQLGAGDMIKIVVFQNPDLTVEARVTENGTISFPLIGEVKVGGFTIPAAEQTIAKALKDGGFIQQPQVNIVLQQIRGYQVAVLGQVNRPGRFPLDTLNVRVSEMIAIAGGITVATGADVAVLTGTREGKPFRKEIDIAGMFADRNRLQDDLVVAGGDVIYVQRAPIFYIYGEVQRPGSYRVERNMTVRQALAQGGGPTLRGTERWLRLHRRGADGKVAILRPGFDDPVQPDDVIYVRESIF
ncbi:MAG: polysaccharide export protein EpsE [Betaproteobacteria bacterium]|nr:polysaccharide export protein EpsE [Betaproteobacteria bacterium]